MVEHQIPDSRVTSQPLGTHGYSGDGGVVFSKDLEQLELGSLSVI